MKRKLFLGAALSGTLMFGQFGGGNGGNRITDRRNAEIRGGGGEGKCTIEVEVDDTADVEIMGSSAQIRTINGSPATFRRFECNQAMPANPSGFRFQGVDGRGQQDLVNNPQSGRRGAVIRIVDSKGGREGYTFDIFWTGGSDGYYPNNDGGFGNNRPGNNRPGNNRPGNGGIWNPGNGNGNGNGGGWGNGNGNGNGNWNAGNGTGWGSGWGGNNTLNFSGRGNGEYRDERGRSGRLSDPNVTIDNRGRVRIAFQSDRGVLNLNGTVERMDQDRVFARVQGGDVYGTIEMEVNGRNRIRSIYLPMGSGSRHEIRWGRN